MSQSLKILFAENGAASITMPDGSRLLGMYGVIAEVDGARLFEFRVIDGRQTEEASAMLAEAAKACERIGALHATVPEGKPS